MRVRLLTGKKAGKIADVTWDYGRKLVESGEAVQVGIPGEIWPQAEEETLVKKTRKRKKKQD